MNSSWCSLSTSAATGIDQKKVAFVRRWGADGLCDEVMVATTTYWGQFWDLWSRKREVEKRHAALSRNWSFGYFCDPWRFTEEAFFPKGLKKSLLSKWPKSRLHQTHQRSVCTAGWNCPWSRSGEQIGLNTWVLQYRVVVWCLYAQNSQTLSHTMIKALESVLYHSMFPVNHVKDHLVFTKPSCQLSSQGVKNATGANRKKC